MLSHCRTLATIVALDTPAPACYVSRMAQDRPRTLLELLLLSDLGRADPARARELLDRCADPVTEDRNTPRRQVRDAEAA